jgi:glycerol-3-phosphate dehydrogenase
MNRNIALLSEGDFDLLIVGGGITGAGVALDAASRGLRVALIDKGDFASATSSASSKLIHGGLRYLEHGQLGLVYESLHDRRLLLRNAPHLVRPLRFILPYYRGARLPRWQARTGLLMYDLLAGSRNLSRSRGLSPLRLRRAFPALRERGLLGGAAYFDAQMDDARLGLEVVATAAQHRAAACNYVEALDFHFVAGQPATVRVRDHVSGQMQDMRARQVLNATGPWVDRVRQQAGVAAETPALQPTKGVHIILAGTPFADGGEPRSRNTAFTLLHPADGRVFFVLPWMGHTLLGTTDTFCDESADALTVSADEEQYLLDGYNQYFAPAFDRTAIRGRFAGLRPLLRSDANDPSARSREFRIIEDANGLMSLAGGKYTTYRQMAETITDRICERLANHQRCRTADIALIGTPAELWNIFAPRETARLATKYGWDAAMAAHLVQRYGRRAGDAAELIAERGEFQTVVAGEPDVVGEWEYQCREEMAILRADHLLRRSRIGLWHPELLQ